MCNQTLDLTYKDPATIDMLPRERPGESRPLSGASAIYRVRDGILIHIPGLPSPEYARPFTSLFTDIPPTLVDAGYLELGVWQDDSYQQEMQVPLSIGPDGKVWAQVGDLSDLPFLPIEERRISARRILDEFLEIYDGWVEGQESNYRPPDTLHTMPVSEAAGWLKDVAADLSDHGDHPEIGCLLQGVVGELTALGF